LCIFFVYGVACSACLTYVFQWAVKAFHLVYATFGVFVCSWMSFHYVLYCVLNAIFICVSLNNFVISLVSFPLYVQVTHFVFWCCGSVSVFRFHGAGCFMSCLYYIYCYVVFFIMFSFFFCFFR
jgi:hypothetical protein